MDSDLVEIILGVVFTIVIWVTVTLFKWARKKTMQVSQPSEPKMEQYTAAIQEMRAANAGYHEQLSYLLQQGLSKAHAENLIAQVEREARG